ncbi:MAG: hypothetical protein LC624_12130, partial [Halobacteriales archaeon]|nr:hypothetical protein [Halobacteriales archaeon]
MATRGLTAGLLAILTLATLLSPLAAGQFGGSSSSTSSPGAVVIGTSASAYAVGQTVLFTLENNASAPPLNVSGWRLHFTVGAGGTSAERDIPLNASLNATLANATEVAPGGRLDLRWDSANAAIGSYTGFLFDERGLWRATINAQASWGASWAVQAAASFASIQLATASTWQAGQAITLKVTNSGPSAVSDACGPRITVRSGSTAAIVYDSTTGAGCASATLQPGEAATPTWDQRGNDGQQVPAGSYVVRADFGSATAQSAFRIQGAAPQGTQSLALRIAATAQTGEAVHVLLVNTGTLDARGALRLQVTDAKGSVVYARDDGVTLTLPANGTFEVLWDQRDGAAKPVPAGAYSVHVALGELAASGSVRVAAKPSPTPAPQPPAGGTSVVGGFDIPPAGVTANYTGQYVTFQLRGSALTDLTVGGAAVLSLDIGSAQPAGSGPGFVRFASATGQVTVFDNPYPSLRADVPGGAAQWSLAFAPGVQLRLTDDGASFDSPRVHGVLLLRGQGHAGLDGASRLSLTFDNAPGSTPGFIARITPGPAPHAGASSDSEQGLPAAIAQSRVAAEAYIAPGSKVSVVPYVSAANVTVTGSSAGALDLRVDVDEHQGRVLVFHLGQGVLSADAQHVRVLLDGQAVRLADNVTDVLDPDDDGLSAEFAVVAAGQG